MTLLISGIAPLNGWCLLIHLFSVGKKGLGIASVLQV